MPNTASRNPRRSAAGAEQSARQVDVKDYRFKEKRKNNPSAGLATYNFKEIKKVSYSYDPHLDPQLTWAGKAEHTSFDVDTVSLHIHERISTQAILKAVQHRPTWRQERLFAEPELGMDKQIEFYKHEMDWANRLILGDSLLVTNSLLERELMEGRVQMVYLDPPYGVAYNSNFQPTVKSYHVKDANDESLTREPEQIKAYRDTWTLGVHSYLTYLRDRLLLCHRLLHESGSIFVQIGEENFPYVSLLTDEIFRKENRVAIISFRKTSGKRSQFLPSTSDHLLWYAKDISKCKYRQLFLKKSVGMPGAVWYDHIVDPGAKVRRITREEREDPTLIPTGSKFASIMALLTQGTQESRQQPFTFQGISYKPGPGQEWKTDPDGMHRLADANRLYAHGRTLKFIRLMDDFAYFELTNIWDDTWAAGFTEDKLYSVQTATKVVERCILMTTDPGDLVFDPTCGSGTTAYSSEKLGRRWITCDTSRVALSLARQRIMTGVFPYYKLANPEQGIYGGFDYETASHLTLKSIAQNGSASVESLYDKPIADGSKVRVSGPFTVEAIPIASAAQDESPASIVNGEGRQGVGSKGPKFEPSDYINTLIGILGKDGVTFPGGKKLILENLRPMQSSGFVHAEGTAGQNGAKLRVALSFGPRYGPVGVRQVDEALRSANRTGFDMLIFAGFAVDPEARAVIEEKPLSKLQVHFANISPDVILADLLKTTRGSQLFTVFGEPDIRIRTSRDEYVVNLQGVDIYDPVTGQVHQSEGPDVPAWFLDEDYDGLTFRASQIFFPKEASRKNPWDKLENALRNSLDKERMESFRGLESLPFKAGKDKRIAVKVIDVRGNEVMVTRNLNESGYPNLEG